MGLNRPRAVLSGPPGPIILTDPDTIKTPDSRSYPVLSNLRLLMIATLLMLNAVQAVGLSITPNDSLERPTFLVKGVLISDGTITDKELLNGEYKRVSYNCFQKTLKSEHRDTASGRVIGGVVTLTIDAYERSIHLYYKTPHESAARIKNMVHSYFWVHDTATTGKEGKWVRQYSGNPLDKIPVIPNRPPILELLVPSLNGGFAPQTQKAAARPTAAKEKRQKKRFGNPRVSPSTRVLRTLAVAVDNPFSQGKGHFDNLVHRYFRRNKSCSSNRAIYEASYIIPSSVKWHLKKANDGGGDARFKEETVKSISSNYTEMMKNSDGSFKVKRCKRRRRLSERTPDGLPSRSD